MTDLTPDPCKFCKASVSHAPLQDTYGAQIYFCYPCSTEYIYWDGGKYYSASIYVTYRNKMYRWTMYDDISQLWYVKTPGEPGVRKNENLELMKVFKDNLPDITPNNFLEKLPVYLLFL